MDEYEAHFVRILFDANYYYLIILIHNTNIVGTNNRWDVFTIEKK